MNSESKPDLLVDMHFHLDFCKNPDTYAAAAADAGVHALAVSCEPAGYERVRSLAHPVAEPLFLPALGLHPWWVARGELSPDALADFERLAPDAPAFGEIGLDFDDRHTPPDSHAAQIAAFERACAAADASSRAAGIRKPLSLHAFRATNAALDVLERTGCLKSCACILHWFADSQPELARAIQAGCWFSVNERAARSRRWREYTKLVPADRLLLETDLPEDPSTPLAPAEHRQALENAADRLAAALGHDVRTQTTRNSRALLAEPTRTVPFGSAASNRLP